MAEETSRYAAGMTSTVRENDQPKVPGGKLSSTVITALLRRRVQSINISVPYGSKPPPEMSYIALIMLQQHTL